MIPRTIINPKSKPDHDEATHADQYGELFVFKPVRDGQRRLLPEPLSSAQVRAAQHHSVRPAIVLAPVISPRTRILNLLKEPHSFEEICGRIPDIAFGNVASILRVQLRDGNIVCQNGKYRSVEAEARP